MLQSIEKTFDSAFFNANHSLGFIQQFISQINDGILAENLGEQLEHLIQNVVEQLSVLAFCFAQIMCKTILFSENCFIIKERLSRLQMENFHLKSDKSFMDFFRKIIPNLPIENRRSDSRSQNPSNRSKRTKRKSKSKPITDHGRKSVSSKKINSNVIVGDNFENNLIYNLSQNDRLNIRFNHRHYYETDAFRMVYRNFKETELISNLRSENLDRQREIIMLETELATHRLMVRYLNNQLSGRIQQIQLLTRDRKDSNFDQVWSDLESEISLNKFKTISNALNTSSVEHGILMNLFRMQNNTSTSTDDHDADDDDQTVVEPNETEKQSIDQIDEIVNDDNDDDNDRIMENEKSMIECKNFQKSWYNIGQFRFIIIDLNDEALGINITGGKEYGLPIFISKIHPNTPAQRSLSFITGDIILSVNFIDFTDLTHDEAVDLLKNLSGHCRFGVVYLKIDGKKGSIMKKFSNDQQYDNQQKQSFVDYYRSIFNATVMSPFQLSSSSSSSDDNDDYPQISSICDRQTDDDDCDSDYKPLQDIEILQKQQQSVEIGNQTGKNAIPGMAKLVQIIND